MSDASSPDLKKATAIWIERRKQAEVRQIVFMEKILEELHRSNDWNSTLLRMIRQRDKIIDTLTKERDELEATLERVAAQ